MKKITNNELTETVKVDVFFNVLYDVIKPVKLHFEVEMLKNDVKGITLQEWFKKILNNKLVISSTDNIPETVEPLQRLFPEIFTVQNTDIDYICKTIYFILNSISPNNIQTFRYE
jgi:hypothetical protein